MLDVDFGTYPFVTSSNTVTAGTCTGLGIAPTRIGNVIGIFKAYCTRVGSGPFPTELNDEVGEFIRQEGHEFGATTGRPRRTGWIDLPALKYAIMVNGVTELAMMKADVLDKFETIRACTHYIINGEKIDYLPFDINDVEVTPVYEDVNGWNADLTKLTDFSDAPQELKDYGGGSGTGLQALIENQVDVANSSRIISDEEYERAKNNGVTPVPVIVAMDAIAMITNSRLGIDSLSVFEVRDILSGKITNWKEVGGIDTAIVVYGRDQSSGTRDYIRKNLLKSDFASGSKALTTSTEIIRQSVRRIENEYQYFQRGIHRCVENENNEVMSSYLLKNAVIVNEGTRQEGDVYIKNGIIERIGTTVSVEENHEVIDLNGAYLLPGCIDDQVHFREPGLTHKATIASESRAAVAGGITSFMEMPNTVPNALTQELLEEKYLRASQTSIANYSFFMGASNDNIDEVLKTNPENVCGVKVFMGSSTGNMLVDSEETLTNLFSSVPMLIATHCEDEVTIRANAAHYRSIYGEEVPVEMHPLIRSAEACYKSSSLAVELAKKHGARLHILHISTEKELSLFENTLPLEQKKITAEA
ncbi:adenylosuccinate synthase, partial [Ancylostoma ceylanicum]